MDIAAHIGLQDRLLDINDMLELARRSRASLYRDIAAGLLEKPIGPHRSRARWTWGQWETYRVRLKDAGR